MRLSCPNCGAQYEVPDDVIPESGRDVQCSNCGDTWFQAHPDQNTQEAADMAADMGLPIPDQDWVPDDAEVSNDDAPQDTPAPGADEHSDNTQESHDTSDTADHDAPLTEAEPPARRELDPMIAEVLRQEAEHETKIREEENNPTLETQQELGIGEPDDGETKRAREARARMARMRGQPDIEENAPEDTRTLGESRRELLPDIEEINSTLRSTGDRPLEESAAVAMDMRKRQRGGFRMGFSLMLILAAAIVLIYANAPVIKETAPQIAPVIDGLVAAMNKGRLWLDEHLTVMMQWLDAKASNASSG